MQAIGLCRFSYPVYGGFQIRHKTIDERIQFLYAEDRLEERFRLFEHVALPCMKAQTNENWEMIVVIGDSLPKHHADRLQDVVAMWIESLNRFNDSGASQQRHISFAPLTENETKQFKTRFAIDPEQIKQTFAGVALPPARGKS